MTMWPGMTLAMRPELFAPVAAFEVVNEILEQGTFAGIAAPAGGTRPCAVKLMADEETVSIAKAVSYDEVAEAKGIRMGWCGFTIGGLQQALAVSTGKIELRCIASDQVLQTWEPSKLANMFRPSRRAALSVADLCGRAKRDGGCADIAHVLPLAEDLLMSNGRVALVRASYLYFLLRKADEAGVVNNLTFSSIVELWNRLRTSEECRRLGNVGLRGPFEPGFPFPLAALDTANHARDRAVV